MLVHGHIPNALAHLLLKYVGLLVEPDQGANGISLLAGLHALGITKTKRWPVALNWNVRLTTVSLMHSQAHQSRGAEGQAGNKGTVHINPKCGVAQSGELRTVQAVPGLHPLLHER